MQVIILTRLCFVFIFHRYKQFKNVQSDYKHCLGFQKKKIQNLYAWFVTAVYST